MLALLPCLWLVVVSTAPGPAPGALREFGTIEVREIENKRNAQGKKLPDEWMPGLRDELRYAIGSLHLFHRIEDQVDSNAVGPDNDRVLQLQVRIVNYSGARNNASISTMITFVDKGTGEVVLSKGVDAKLYYDQGATSAALIKLANKVRDLTKDAW
jgi:hypothetical protein